MFNEQTLRAAIKEKWGEYGAHMDVFDTLIRKASENAELNDKIADLQDFISELYCASDVRDATRKMLEEFVLHNIKP